MGKRSLSALDARPLFEQCEPRLLLDGTWLTPVSLETGASGQYCDVAIRDDGNLAMVY